MTPSVAHSLLQLVAFAAAAVGLYLVAGLAWALLVAGSVTFLASVLMELGRPHRDAVKGGA